MKKTVFAVMFGVLLTSTLYSAFKIMPTEAAGTIYIRADGSIDPPTAAIATADNITYTFTYHIYDSIVVERDNIVVDGGGYMAQGTDAHYSKGISVSGRSNVTIKSMTINAFDYGIWLGSASNNSISGNNITANYWGIELNSSSNNCISGNNVTNNHHGISLNSSSNYNSISGNNITANNGDGISLSSSSNNSINGNHIADNDYGMGVGSSSNYNIISGNSITASNDYGVVVGLSSNNVIIGNIITNNWEGIILISSSHNSIIGNNITNSISGIVLSAGPSDDRIYHNNLIDNVQQVFVQYPCANVWDNGYPSGGNYWNDHIGTDLFSGPYQNETGSDSISDSPYVIDESNQDNYPLMNAIHPIQGDVNWDQTVDIFDCVIIALAFSSKPCDPNWNPVADINNDQLVDIFDIVVVALHFGETG